MNIFVKTVGDVKKIGNWVFWGVNLLQPVRTVA